MFAWSLAARTVDEVERVLRGLERHRYLAEVDHTLHWSVVLAAVVADDRFESAAADLKTRFADAQDLDLSGRDGRLWVRVNVDQVVAVLRLLWSPSDAAVAVGRDIAARLRRAGVEPPSHAAFESDPDDPPHPELLRLDWVLLPVDQLDAERHAGALRAMAESGEDVAASEPAYLEGPTLSEVELCHGAPRGVLPTDLMLWADGPYGYCDYLLRGVARASKLVAPPVGYRDVDQL